MFITIRHFSDQNALRNYGHNAPLKSNQEELLEKTVKKIIKELKRIKKNKVKLLYTKKTRRINDTAKMIANSLIKDGVKVVFKHDSRLEVMDQGDLNLPDNYKDGEWFDSLDVAWDAICTEAYINKNIFYNFGDHLDNKYPVLKQSFSRFGESMGWSLINKYSLIYDLIHEELVKEDELLVIVSQSDLPLILTELKVLNNRKNINSVNLPYECWKVYKEELQEVMCDKKVVEKGNFDVPMGHFCKFNLKNFRNSGFDKIIKESGLVLFEKKYEKI